MIVTKKSLPRRTFLRGIGTTLALPLLDAMAPALAATPGRQATSTAGVRVRAQRDHPGDWLPAAEGVGFEFPSTMKPLEPFRDRLLVLSGLAQVTAGRWAMGRAITRAPALRGSRACIRRKPRAPDIHAGISADQIAAQEFGKATQFASLELGLEEPSLAGRLRFGL